jgi:hypothetical protein
MGKKSNAHKILIQKPEGKRPLGRHRYRWEDNIKMGHTEIQCEVMEWITLTQGRVHWWALVNMVMDLWIPKMWEVS